MQIENVNDSKRVSDEKQEPIERLDMIGSVGGLISYSASTSNRARVRSLTQTSTPRVLILD